MRVAILIGAAILAGCAPAATNRVGSDDVVSDVAQETPDSAESMDLAAPESMDLEALEDVAAEPDVPEESDPGPAPVDIEEDTGPVIPDCTPKRTAYTVSYADVVAVADISCAGSKCHNPGDLGGLTLDDLYGNTVGVPSKNSANLRVHPGKPFKSFIYQKILGTGLGARMPFGGAPLPKVQQDMFLEWIEDCASPAAVAGQPTSP